MNNGVFPFENLWRDFIFVFLRMANSLQDISKKVLDKLEHLKCPICLDIVENVRELPCRHIFCSNCLETYKKDKDTLSCPLCKKEVSRRKLLSHDAALDALCGFVKTLCDDVRTHHKSDAKTFFSKVFDQKVSSNKFKLIIESDEIIPLSSDENIIPCTSKASDKKKFIKRRNLNTTKLDTKNAPKPIELEIKKNSCRDEKKKTQPKLGLSRRQNKPKVDSTDNSIPNLKPKHAPQHQKNSIYKEDKNKILRWLNDTRNCFERFSQTQTYATQNYTPQDIDMPSVSQILDKKLRKNKKYETVQEKPLISDDKKEIALKRTRSVENLVPSEFKKLRRHSLECTSPNKMKQYHNLQQINSIENKLIIDIIEDEVLDVIDKEISGGNNKKKTPLSSNKNHNDHEKTGTMNKKENEFLDQLDDEMLENSVESKKKSSCRKIDFNSSEIGKENKSKSSWKSIKKFKKSIGKTKVPRKLDISLQSTQKSTKKEAETKMNTSDKLANISIMENKTVDFQKMEDYFSKALPQMIENNKEETPPPEKMSDEDIYQKKIESNDKIKHEELKTVDEKENDNDSDIYIYQTQPLSKEIIDPKIDKISYAAKLTKKLDNILQELIKEDKIKTGELTSLFPSIENIFEIFHQLGNEKKHTPPKVNAEKIHISFSEKQIQTDIFSLDGFPITPSAAFKSLAHEDVGTQTDNFCFECPHSFPRTTSPLLRDDSAEKTKKISSLENGTQIESSIEVEQNNLDCKSQIKKTNSQPKTSSIIQKEFATLPSPKEPIKSLPGAGVKILNVTTLKIQNSSNLTKEKTKNTNVHLDSQILIDHILDQCSTQYNSGTSPNKSKINGNSSASKTQKGESKLDTSQGSAIMFSLPRSNSGVNRKLMFEKTLKERKELEQTLKRARSENTSSCEDERPYKVKCNRFLQDDLSIEFESESLNENSQYKRTSDVEMVEYNDASTGARNKSFSCEITKTENKYKRTQNLGEFTQTDTLLNYCDDLIEKANRQISHEDILSEHNNDTNLSQILIENNRSNEKLNKSSNKRHLEEKTQQPTEKIKTQDLLKHYDELIDKANKQIDMENVPPKDNQTTKVQYGCSQIATTSKLMDPFVEDNRVQEEKNVMKTQDLLDHCNALIEKTTKEIGKNEIQALNIQEKNVKAQSENDDEFFCQNLDHLDSVLEKENNKLKEKLSESLFESCKENLSHEPSVLEKTTIERMEDILLSTPKRRKTVDEREKMKKLDQSKPTESDGFNSSDDEIFSDVDVVETTPQKALSFIERLSCSQVVNQNSRGSLKLQENSEHFPSSINIVPPPPGFDDAEEKESEKNMGGNSERESENVIPNSLSPQRFEIPAPRRPIKMSNSSLKNPAVPQEVATLSQQFMKVSPICRDKSKNLNVIEMVRQSKFSPLTIVPISNPVVLTSTPKQKSILSYTKPKSKTLQEEVASTLTCEKTKPCVAFTRLNNAETLCVLSLCNKNLATRQDKFGPDVTHMIVSVDKHNHLKDHTIKFISSIAAGIWVLNIKWVQECLTRNCIVDEEPFEVLDISGTPSPRISRLNRLTNPLLKGFKFFIPRSFAQTSADDVKNIIQLLQGEVASSIEELTSADREKYTCIIISELIDTEDYTQYENWLMSHKLVTVDINWLSLSVSRYKVLSLRPHLICSDDYIEELGYPSNLVADVPPTLTEDMTAFD